eukprot:7518035-Alexandrium_andersonii.AAC.1
MSRGRQSAGQRGHCAVTASRRLTTRRSGWTSSEKPGTVRGRQTPRLSGSSGNGYGGRLRKPSPRIWHCPPRNWPIRSS